MVGSFRAAARSRCALRAPRDRHRQPCRLPRPHTEDRTDPPCRLPRPHTEDRTDPDIEDLNQRIATLNQEIAELLHEHDNPLADLQGAGTNLTAAVIAQAGDVRRFRDAAAFARFCGAAPIPCGSGQTAGRHRLHRGGNRQLNAALYRIAIVQQRHHPQAQAFLARKTAEGKTPREARRALKRHLANVLYRRLTSWANTCPEMNLLT